MLNKMISEYDTAIEANLKEIDSRYDEVDAYLEKGRAKRASSHEHELLDLCRECENLRDLILIEWGVKALESELRTLKGYRRLLLAIEAEASNA